MTPEEQLRLGMDYLVAMYFQAMRRGTLSDPALKAHFQQEVSTHVAEITDFLLDDILTEAKLGRMEIRTTTQELRSIYMKEIEESRRAMLERIDRVMREELERLQQKLAAESARLRERYDLPASTPFKTPAAASDAALSRLLYSATRAPVAHARQEFKSVADEANEASNGLQDMADARAQRLSDAGSRAMQNLRRIIR